MLDYLRQQGVDENLLTGIQKYREQFGRAEEERLISPRYLYDGCEVWEQALAALLSGENLLLAGPKGTGKNVLAENLAAVFGRPLWNVSFHINMDASYMIGTDTFADGRVSFRPGPIYECAQQGGFAVLDEINMARNEALAVLHSLLDFRRTLDVPGYQRMDVHPAARFVATMNYGYAGTRELNEALLSRFVVLQLKPVEEKLLAKMLQKEDPAISAQLAANLAGFFMELQEKAANGEITEKAVDLRGLLAAVRLQEQGLSLRAALNLGVVNKTFDDDERTMIEDIMALRFSEIS